ncbi:hypothetical protein Trco_003286 [Trichoderma cornu-damae]|uniref:Uncharacterized protein n=1 Tax=Trichoderma cornu-damae TaxID=654480 RepID=A0A9P8QR18_9HYPO|nr:hypothetical protein Trco_003286 [Trichoderma cornu-damae]
MPFYELPDSLHPWSSNALMNVALEYDTAWMEKSGPVNPLMYQENSTRGCFIRTLWAVAGNRQPPGGKFWLIDRTIQKRDRPFMAYIPSSDSDDEIEQVERKTTVFHGYNRRYVEIRDLTFHFLHWLQIEVGFNTRWIMNQRGSKQNNTAPPVNGLSDLVNVLCEERM